MRTFQQILQALKTTSLPVGMRWRTRFAPSPTGYLHLGHVAAAAYVWLTARIVDAEILLRIEDHDHTRSREEHILAIYEDLEWLGFSGATRTPRQSERESRYREAFQRLVTLKKIYGCRCTRKNIAARILHQEAHQDLIYDGFCRERQFKGGTVKRLIVADELVEFEDLFLGKQWQDLSVEVGDFIIRDRDGLWSYHFANVVDDFDQEVNLIIRGDDILSSTGRQIYLRQLLGFREITTYAHHPTLKDTSGLKLSKREKAASIRGLREEGVPSAVILGKAAFNMGLIANERPVSMHELEDILRKHLQTPK